MGDISHAGCNFEAESLRNQRDAVIAESDALRAFLLAAKCRAGVAEADLVTLRTRIDDLHDQRHAEARRADEARAALAAQTQECERLDENFRDAHRAITEWMEKCVAAEDEVARLTRLTACPPVVTRELARAREGRNKAEAECDALHSERKGVQGALIDSGVTFDTRHLDGGVAALTEERDRWHTIADERSAEIIRLAEERDALTLCLGRVSSIPRRAEGCNDVLTLLRLIHEVRDLCAEARS